MPRFILTRSRTAVGLVLLALLAACTQVETQLSGPLTPAASPNDSKAYRYVELDNRLRVLLISDPDADKAAASLDVHVGSASNPRERAGLAHFLEHMLFLGTDKYPDSGEYARFISEHGGNRNAYTAFEHTNYFFDVDPSHLEPALDRFAQFFISPRFDKEYVDREVNAVEAEYQLGLNSDGRRNLDVLREIVNPTHPYSILGVGTKDTLADRPGDPVREDLLAFYEQFYSANLMTLAVLGSETLNELELMVRDIFSPIPNRDVQVATIEAPLYGDGSLPMQIYIRPQASQRQLQLSFPMPNYTEQYHAKPLSYIGNLIGHEGEGSLLSLLKAEGWADGLGAGMGVSYRGGSAFSISISLTEAGMEQREQVLARLFEYVRLMEAKGPQRNLFDEQAQQAKLAFRFQPDVSPMNYVRSLANDMHLYTPEDILRGNYIMDDYEPQLIQEIVSQYLTPENVAITVVGEQVPVDRNSEFYDTPYSVRSLASDEGMAWRNPGSIDERLHLPAANEFVAENVELVEIAENNPVVPALVASEVGLRVWSRQDDTFAVPKGAMYANFRSALVGDTVANSAAARLYVALLQDAVNEYTYAAYLAGLNFSVFPHSRGISLKISGYNDKQLVLLERIVDSIANANLDTHRFDNLRAALIRSLENTRTARAFSQVVGDARQALVYGQWNEEAMIAELQKLSPADVAAYADAFWASTDVDVMVNGNYAPDVAAGVQQVLQPLLERQREAIVPQMRVVMLPAGEELVLRADVEHDDAVLFWYLQGPDDSIESRAMAAMTAQIVSADYFEELRTDQQLGYVVSAFTWPQQDVPSVVFLVQSPSADAAQIHDSTLIFMNAYAEPGAVSAEQFERHRAALLANVLKPHKNIGEQSEYFWQQIAKRDLGFDSRERMAAAISGIGPEEWRLWYRGHLLQNPASLAVVAPGKSGVLPPGTPVESVEALHEANEFYQRD